MSLDIYLELDTCEHCGRGDDCESLNITHNLGKMAKEAGIYGIVWRPEENGIEFAHQMIEPLKDAIKLMTADPRRFKKHDAPNGWGTYDDFLPWLKEYRMKCVEMSKARIKVSR